MTQTTSRRKQGRISHEEIKRLRPPRRVVAGLEQAKSEHGNQAGKTPSREEMGRVKKEIWAAVEAGKVTEEQAGQRWEAYLKSLKK